MMSPFENQRIRPGDDPVSCPTGRMEISVGSRSGRPVHLEVVGPTDVLRPMGDGRWLLELVASGHGQIRVADPDGDVFPPETILTITLRLPGGLRLKVNPPPDVSSLPGMALLEWEPAPVGRGGDVLVSVAQLDVNRPSDNGPHLPPLIVEVEPLGPVAVQARNLARQMVSGPRLPSERLRDVVVVVDRSTSMRAELARFPLCDAVATVIGTAAVIAERTPSVYLAGGLHVDPVPAPDGPVDDWALRTLRADAFGFSSVGVCQALSAAHPRRDVVLVTDDVPADLDLLRSQVAEEPDSGRWRIVVVGRATTGLVETTGLAERTDSTGTETVQLLGMPAPADAVRTPSAEAVRALVRSLVCGNGHLDGGAEAGR